MALGESLERLIDIATSSKQPFGLRLGIHTLSAELPLDRVAAKVSSEPILPNAACVTNVGFATARSFYSSFALNFAARPATNNPSCADVKLKQFCCSGNGKA